eukprot:9177297-Pyramimonas_sp.AAC.3
MSTSAAWKVHLSSDFSTTYTRAWCGPVTQNASAPPAKKGAQGTTLTASTLRIEDRIGIGKGEKIGKG